MLDHGGLAVRRERVGSGQRRSRGSRPALPGWQFADWLGIAHPFQPRRAAVAVA